MLGGSVVLLDSSPIQGIRVFPCIVKVLGIRLGKIMAAAEIFFCTHI